MMTIMDDPLVSQPEAMYKLAARSKSNIFYLITVTKQQFGGFFQGQNGILFNIIIIIKLYLDTVNSGTAVPFTGVYTHDQTNNGNIGK